MKLISYLFILLLLLVGVSFAVLNANSVAFNYYFATINVPLSLLLVLSFVAGLLLTFIIMSFSIVSLKAQRRRLQKRLKVAEQEIDNLRVMPVKD